jgi:hypothetical protein
MKLTIKILAIVLLGIFLVGCGSSGGGGDAKTNYKTGTGGLRTSFFNNAPPDKIYPGSEFRIILQLDNEAAYDLNEGEVSIIGLDTKYFQVDPLQQIFPILEGKNFLNPSGGKDHIEFKGTTGKLFQNAQSYRGNYFLKTKYKSSVEFSDTICLSPRLYEIYDSGCNPQEKKGYSGQGAPLSVTDIELVSYPIGGAGAKIEFRVRLRNLGNGLIDKVYLKGARLGGGEFQACEFQGPVIDSHEALLSSNKQEVMLLCETVLESSSSYETTLAFDFEYDYETKEQHQLNLVNPNAQSSSSSLW